MSKMTERSSFQKRFELAKTLQPTVDDVNPAYFIYQNPSKHRSIVCIGYRVMQEFYHRQ